MKTKINLSNELSPFWQAKPTLLLTVLLALLFIASCSKDSPEPAPVPISEPDPDPETTSLTFAEVIASGDDFEPFPESRTEEIISESEPEIEDSQLDEDPVRWLCTTKTVDVLDGSGEFSLFNPNASVIYPGSLVQGKTLSAASPSPIVVARAGGSISYNLNDGNPTSSIDVLEVKKSTIQAGMNGIISGAVGVVPANFQLDIIQIESETQLALEMGFSVETFATKASGDMSFSTEKEFNRTLVKMNQTYYTMSFDLPTSNDQIFGADVTPEDLAKYVQPDNPATFISDVTYGRIFYMLIESTSSRQQMEASLNLAYDGFAASAEGSLEVSAFEALNDLKIKVIAYGGDATGAFALAGETSIADIATSLGNSTNIAAGLPISYVARSVERPDQIVGTKLSTEYDVVECDLKGILPPDNYLGLLDLFEDGIGAASNTDGSNIFLVNKAGDKTAVYTAGSASVNQINDISVLTQLGLTLNEIGAAARYIDRERRQYFLFLNGSGILGQFNQHPFYFQQFEVSTLFGAFEPSYPFAGDGIDAVLSYNGFESGGSTFEQDFFSNDGSQFATLTHDYLSGTNTWGARQETSDWRGQALFDNVGAACRVQFGNTSQFLFFNEAGDEMMISDGTEILGRYVVN